MDKKIIIKNTEEFVRKALAEQGAGHDFAHVERVWKMAKKIAKQEKADMFVVELGALLHDVADYKFHGGDHSVGPKMAREWLLSQNVSKDIIDEVAYIVEFQSFSSSLKYPHTKKSKEFMCVQDADRLEATGAIGIARVFMYNGHKARPLYDPKLRPVKVKTYEDYKNAGSTSINHFYEKLLKLKDLMNTKTGKKFAESRHRLVENFVKQFIKEWHGRV